MARPSWLELRRTVRFGETDAAGVMHFQQLLGWCHQAWEESLERYGLSASSVFPGGREDLPNVALPIVHCHADFRSPLKVGDELSVLLQPTRLDHGSFEVTSQFVLGEKVSACGCLRQVAIDICTRHRRRLPDGIERWIEASSIGQIHNLENQ